MNCKTYFYVGCVLFLGMPLFADGSISVPNGRQAVDQDISGKGIRGSETDKMDSRHRHSEVFDFRGNDKQTNNKAMEDIRNELPCYFRLKFYKNLSDSSCIWEQQIPTESPVWAEESTKTSAKWEDIPDLHQNIKVGLVLGGGLIRGMAHIGVLKILEENNIPINGITGTSIGAIIGGLYSCGYSPDSIERITRTINWDDLFSDQLSRESFPLWERLKEEPKEPRVNLDIRWSRPDKWFNQISGFRTAQKLTDKFGGLSLAADYRAGFDFDNLDIPFGALLMNVKDGNIELMRKGTVSTAARASGSYPMVFEPMKIGDKLYIDGGVLDDLPVDAFIPFDSIRAPKNTIKNGDKSFDYIIAVYPYKIGKKEINKEVSGFSMVDIAFKVFYISRDYYLQSSWNNADAKIDLDVEGGFDFSSEKINKMVEAGYNTAGKQIKHIKEDICTKEGLSKNDIYCLSSIELNGGEGKKKKLLKAIRLRKGSYIEKNDICDAMARMYKLGDFGKITAKMEYDSAEAIKDSIQYCKIVFYLEGKRNCLPEVNRVTVKLVPEFPHNSVIEKILTDTIYDKKKSINFYEIKDLVERSSVNNGTVGLRVDSVNFVRSPEKDTVFVYIGKGVHLKGIIISCRNPEARDALRKEFDSLEVINPSNVLGVTSSAYKTLSLKTIAVEGVRGDSLFVTAERRSTSTVRIPVLTFWNDEGTTFFAEVVTKRSKFFGYGEWSPYLNWTSNYPLKQAEELLMGKQLNLGIQACRSFLPQANLYWGEIFDSSYENSFHTLGAQIEMPIQYRKHFILTPGIEEAGKYEERVFEWKTKGTVEFEWDNLDRIIFPEYGCKGSVDFKIYGDLKKWKDFLSDGKSFLHTRVNMMGVCPWRPMKKFTFLGQVIATEYSENTPDYERYNFGGLNIAGSHQLKLFDSEYFPGYSRNELTERIMFMTGGSARFTFLNISLLGVQAKVHFETSYYVLEGWRAFSFNEHTFSKQSSVVGLHLDTSYFNAGAGLLFKNNKLSEPFVSVTFYGF
ncbi:MAG: patatin-like phospholipase family protein [bacterium]|nr:patatin-like phospholipase family protein [bacterium]